MFCAISGEVPLNAVVCPSGYVYEKRLLLAYIDENGKEPFTGNVVAKEDIVEVKSSPKHTPPRPTHLASVPGLLTALQTEWDAGILEMLYVWLPFAIIENPTEYPISKLRQQYQVTRQELSHALYANDAAQRTLARILAERDEARQALASIQSVTGAATSEPIEVEEAEQQGPAGQLSADVVKSIDDAVVSLSGARKKRPKVSPTGPTEDVIKSFKESLTIPSMHSSSKPGLTSIVASQDGSQILTGGMDNHTQLYSVATGKIVSTMKGHTKKITAVAMIESSGVNNGLAISASADKKIKTYSLESGKVASTIASHSSEVVALDVHPIKSYLLSASHTEWAMHDLEKGTTIQSHKAPEGESGSFTYSSLSVHPDGALMGAGTEDGIVRVWDIRQGALVASFPGHQGVVQSLSFSENGYTLACAASSSPSAVVKLWDLRKLSCTHTIDLGEASTVKSVKFDPSAAFLAVGGTDVRIFKSKTWEDVSRSDNNAAEITGLSWAKGGHQLFAAGMDRNVRLLSA